VFFPDEDAAKEDAVKVVDIWAGSLTVERGLTTIRMFFRNHKNSSNAYVA
jgi:hypothetical protein